MKRFKMYTLIIVFFVLIVQAILFLNSNIKIINAHESVGSLSDIVKLQTVMHELNIKKTILHTLPDDMLYYKNTGKIDLAEYKKNEEILQKTVSAYPDEFDYFCTLNPDDEILHIKAEECIKKHAIGVKMYNGYSYTHTKSIASPEFDQFYKTLSEKNIVLMMPVNMSKYADELDAVLDQNKDLKMICSHYCLSRKNLKKLDEMMTKHKNLFIDTSFGNIELTQAGFRDMSAHNAEFKEFFKKHYKKILFATDLIVSADDKKSRDFVKKVYTDYLNILKSEKFKSSIDENIEYNGLALSNFYLRQILQNNWNKITN